MKRISISALLITAFFAVNAQTTTISGKITNASPEKIKMMNALTEEVVAETAVTDGKYTFEADFAQTDFYLIEVAERKMVIYVPEPGEKAEINIDADNVRAPEVKNSKLTTFYYDEVATIGSLSEEERITKIRSLIDENPTNLVCILLISALDMEADMPYFEKLSKGLKAYSEHNLVADLNRKIANFENLKIGGQAPEIELESPNGELIKLSSLQGNYVLIDFWASWCRPCRMENPNVVKMYEKYHDKGFEIFGVSLDRDKDAWLKAIEDDGLVWTHVSDLKFWQSEGAKAYNVSAIPHTVLLDKEGKIIAKNLRGQSLENKLAELLGE